MGKNFQEKIILQYKFSKQENINKDSSKNQKDAILCGTIKPEIKSIAGRSGLCLTGGIHGSSYVQLPQGTLETISDYTGLTVSTWIFAGIGNSVWERIFDFGKGSQGPYLFLTRNLRGVCFGDRDIPADPAKGLPIGEWIHVAMVVEGTQGGTKSNAGPRLYINGELVADGSVSQTSSGTYKAYREWMDGFIEKENYQNCFIGRSQYDADHDFMGYVADFRIYQDNLTEDEIIQVLCDSLSDKEIVELASTKYLTPPDKIITNTIVLPNELMSGKVQVNWTSNYSHVISNEGVVGKVSKPTCVTLRSKLSRNQEEKEVSFDITVMPESIPPYEIHIHGNQEILEISDTLYGLFFEDINNAADGGIYAELIQNRSFEDFTYEVYDIRSGENGTHKSRIKTPLNYWFGDVNQLKIHQQGGLNEFFNLKEKDINETYVTGVENTTIYNKGFTDGNNQCSIITKKDQRFSFTIWAKADTTANLLVELVDEENKEITDKICIQVEGNGNWKKYGKDSALILTANANEKAQLKITFQGEISIDMVSLMPEEVWGFKEEPSSKTAMMNYQGNPNYRLRKDLVETLSELHPKFLRFPGGCISEGSYIWENVYDWKESVGEVEIRKENFNVWGYVMTMGLGYMEYFQLAEDLNCLPLPVMACGVLCQARSDYANPAGGDLQKKYIQNFVDLIDFAINEDYENNIWANLRKEMGHKAPFDLHLLGVGNENWGTEFFASFQEFKNAIDVHMELIYPGYDLKILSTVGAQADDDAYQKGWKFLSGNWSGSEDILFTDGITSKKEHITWYPYQDDYMETIADEHFYRSNYYLLNNVDRYQYYERTYLENGKPDMDKSSKVFVGEYASNDKNTLQGAVAEAAVMTGFERYSDVVRLAAYAPLFNKVRTDGLYRWTPDCIWFDDEAVWRTPNYFVQKLFAENIGTTLIDSTFYHYVGGDLVQLKANGGIYLSSEAGSVFYKQIKVTDNKTGKIIFEEDFTKGLREEWILLPGFKEIIIHPQKGLFLEGSKDIPQSIYLPNLRWSNYSVEVIGSKVAGMDGFYVGVGVTEPKIEKRNALVYAVGYQENKVGLKVYKDGIEGYTLGDYSSSSAAGNFRGCYENKVELNEEYSIHINFGGADEKQLLCSYGKTKSKNAEHRIQCKLDPYNKDIFYSVTKDEQYLYIKLVNADRISKKTQIVINQLMVENEARLITLTGEEHLVSVPNVNQKGHELICPKETRINLVNQQVTLSLPSNSVEVLILKLL